MAELLTPAEIERRAQAAGKSMKRVCQEAEIAQSTFSRWKAGQTEPTLSVYRRLVEAVTPREGAQQAEAA